MYVRKVLGFCCFCFVAAFFFACSEDLLVSIGSDKVEVNDDLKAPVNLVVETRYRDSVFIGTVGRESYKNQKLIDAGKADEVIFAQFNKPELKWDSKNYLEHMEQFLHEFFLSWSVVDGSVGYEVRVSTRPITKENWLRAEKIVLKSTMLVGETVKAVASIAPSPSIYSTRCVNCKSCQTVCPTAAISMQDRKAVIDFELCIECGECFRSCEYNAIGGVFAGSAYYFAIRPYDDNNAFASEVLCSNRRYKLRYVSMASIPDSLAGVDSTSGYYVKNKTRRGCGGNCGDWTKRSYRSRSDPCHIIDKNACPANAVYEVDSADMERKNTKAGAIFIDFDKCINCGECAQACYKIGPYGAIVTEMIEVP